MHIIDLFSGAGGLTEGFVGEGFNVVAHVEKDHWACETLRTRIAYQWLRTSGQQEAYRSYIQSVSSYRDAAVNREHLIFSRFPELRSLVYSSVLERTFGDPTIEPETVSGRDVIEEVQRSMLQDHIQNIDVVIGGPPCQAYSIIGRSRMRDKATTDRRNYLFRYYLDIVNEFRPKLFVFENVPGLLTACNGEVIKAIQEELDVIGYGLTSGVHSDHRSNVVNAQEFGVPQKRKRLILIGYDQSRFPSGFRYPSFEKPASIAQDTREAIGDLPPVNPGEGSDYWYLEYITNTNLTPYQYLMRTDSSGVTNHKARIHRPQDLDIYTRAINQATIGERLYYSDLPESLKTHKNQYIFQDRFRVHSWDQVPHTVVAHISKDGHYNIHPDINQLRSLTVREAARIQSFPDNYWFEGPRTSQFTQVGNAVPPLLSRSIAKSIKTLLNNERQAL